MVDRNEVLMARESLPTIIQGGMGAGVSGWRLARAVSMAGQLGVVSGTALDVLLARRLQRGDPDGHVRRALEHFPFPEIAQRILDRYFLAGGKAPNQPFKSTPCPNAEMSRQARDLLVAGNFVEVFLAAEDHECPVGINYLEKIQLRTLPSLFGAMLAGVDWVLMGAGIPKSIPGHIDRFAAGEATKLKLDVKNADPGEAFFTEFDPHAFCNGHVPLLKRPGFLAIIASATLGALLVKKSTGRVDGLVVEGPSAGGHNAPPRGRLQIGRRGEPVYGDRDIPDLAAIRALGVPFWLAGSYGSPERVAEALEAGAAGVQVGTAFAYCEESDLNADLKMAILEQSAANEVDIVTDPVASPTGFPFKVVRLGNSLTGEVMYEARPRVCDLAYLRHAYKMPNGALGWRCPAEPVEDYERKGGDVEETFGRKCICNALMANIGLGQIREHGRHEAPLVTSGTDVADVAQFLAPAETSYSARSVIQYLLAGVRQVASGW